MSSFLNRLRAKSSKNAKKIPSTDEEKNLKLLREAKESAVQNDTVIIPDPDTNMPSKVWEEMLRNGGKYVDVEPLNFHTPIYDDKLRFVCLSDTHSKLSPKDVESKYFIPPGDILLHAGDFTMKGGALEIETFNEYLGKLPHKKKVIIAGNHDLPFDRNIMSEIHLFGGSTANLKKYFRQKGIESAKELITNAIYLQDSMVTICGVNIYGSPWQPRYCDWAFNNCERGEDILKKWNSIPNGVDILVTHGPPAGHGDIVKSGIHVGCVELLNTVQKRIKPKYHVFGHIHEGYGVSSDGHTTFINAAGCTKGYKLLNPPIIFDLPLPPGQSKSSLLESVSVTPFMTEETIKDSKVQIEKVDIEKKTLLLQQLKISKPINFDL